MVVLCWRFLRGLLSRISLGLITSAMNPKLVSTSKFLSLVLRHKPEEIGLILDARGWVDIDELVGLASVRGKSLSRSIVEEVVATNEKRRFVISDDGTRIRANQGHSVSVDLGLTPQVPPSTLFHGTATRFIRSIRQEGLRRGNRLHVHLSADEATAMKVGSRHGTPIVLPIDAGAMYEQCHGFYRSENEVWLTEHVPSRFIAFPP
jgi:putative RNA 2'-phosphotransferase